MPRRIAIAAAALVLAAGLSACAAEPGPRLTALPQPSLSASPGAPAGSEAGASADPDATPACVDGVVRIGASSQRFIVRADCPRLEVSGAQVEVTASGAEIVEVIVRGDGNRVTLADPAQIIVEGQGNAVEAVSGGALEIRGNGNEVVVDQALSQITVNGNTNAVTAAELGSVSDNGDGNVIGRP